MTRRALIVPGLAALLAGAATAEDVKFSFERMIGSDWGGRFDAFDHVESARVFGRVVDPVDLESRINQIPRTKKKV